LDSAMAHIQQELVLARERQRQMREAAAAQREGYRAAAHSRIVRRAQRAERQQLSFSEQAARLRAELRQIEAIR
jgi:hypothetical protein